MDYNNLMSSLNDQQKQAVLNIKGSSMVIAGAGSGKTKVLVYKVIYLIKYLNISPKNILVLTFTNKASNEMIKRINIFFRESLFLKKLNIGTFHSVFSRLLHVNRKYLHRDNGYVIYDNSDCENIIKDILIEMNIDIKLCNIKNILSKISYIKNTIFIHQDVNKLNSYLKLHKLNLIYYKYLDKCFSASIMDFDDILIKTYDLFNNNSFVLDKYKKKFKYILVDEFQDTNRIQYNILKQLSGFYKNICVIGDDSQSIYSFRGANLNNMLNFKLDFPLVKTFLLERNYRSTYYIVQAANNVISNNTSKINKILYTDNVNGEKIVTFIAQNPYHEAVFVADKIIYLKGKKEFKNKNFAVLYRYNSQNIILKNIFKIKGLNHYINNNMNLLKNKYVKIIMYYYKFIINKYDHYSLSKIINYPCRGIGLVTYDKLFFLSKKINKSLYDVLNNIGYYYKHKYINISYKIVLSVNNFICLIKKIRNNLNILNVYYLTNLLLNVFNLKHLYKDRNVSIFTENLYKYTIKNPFFNLIKFINFIYFDDADLGQFLYNDDKINLMTIHMSKGLEFDVVFVIGLQEGCFPSLVKNSKNNIEEERRLFYVALTRAKKKIFLTYYLYYNDIKINFKSFKASRFINEINKEYIYSHNKFDYNYNTNKNKLVNIKDIKKYKYYIKVGFKIKHNIFGIGTIKNIISEINNIVMVDFEQFGIKKIFLKPDLMKLIS